MSSPASSFLTAPFRRTAARLALALAATFGAGTAAATTYVVFRYDDLAADKAGSRAYDKARQALWEAEQANDRLFARFQMPYLAAVVPNQAGVIQTNVVALSEDPEKVAFIKEAVAAGRMQVALHGYTHWNYSASNVRRGEFRRADAQAQNDDIAAGRKILGETLGLKEITTFVPPFNGWNEHTAAALVRNGFTILSADRQWNTSPTDPLVHIPFTAQLWELDHMLDHGDLPKDSVVVVLYHPPQIVRQEGIEFRYYGLDKLAALLTRLAAMPEVKVVTLDQLRATGMDLSAARYNASVNTGRLQSAWAQILPARLLPGFAGRFRYQTEGEYRDINMAWRALTVATATALLAGGWLLCRITGRLLPPTPARLLSVGAVLALAASAWLLVEIARRGFHPTSVRFFPPWLLIGWLLAALKHELGRARKQPAPASVL